MTQKYFAIVSRRLDKCQLIRDEKRGFVKSHQHHLEPFSLQRSTRHGRSSSPLLFTLATEPRATAVRALTGLSGITIGGMDHHISLYADDIILFLTNLKYSIPI